MRADPIAASIAEFHRRYRDLHGHGSLTEAIEFVNLRCVASCQPPAPLPAVCGPERVFRRAACARSRSIRGRAIATSLSTSAAISVPAAGIEGPAIIEQGDTTTVIHPGQSCIGAASGSLVICWERLTVIDPVTLEVLRNRFNSIAEEIQLTLLRSSYSVILKEGEDCSAAVFSAAGEIIAQSTALPQHMGAFIPALARIVEEFPVTEMQPGDIFCMNDPHDGGTHLPDLVVAMPVVVGGRVVAFSVCLAHQEDIGGKVPGSMPTNSTEIFQEGLIIPPSQLHVAGVPNRTLFKLIERNVRLPRLVLGDIGAQIAAVTNGARRIEDSLPAYGSDLVLGLHATPARLRRAVDPGAHRRDPGRGLFLHRLHGQ